MRLAVFWEPPDPVRHLVLQEKERCKRLLSDAPYLSHPVHSTIFGVDTDRPEECLGLFEHAATSATITTTSVDSWIVFRADPATGGDTIALKLHLSDQLMRLQEIVAATIAPCRTTDWYPGSDSWLASYSAQSNKQYGFPFVGDHWIPHVTIASLPRSSALVEVILARPVPHERLSVNELSLWHVEQDHHERLVSCQIGEAQ